jgi:AcrR family transcriptional regulator
VSNARERVHQAVREDIVDEARRQLADGGASALSLRAVARELGMASSAMYRYFTSRDELITALIVDAYNAMGEVAEGAALTSGSAAARFGEVCRAVRAWSLDHPHEYALLYGSPVPGYEAPGLTVGPASRVSFTLGTLVVEGLAQGELVATELPSVPRALAGQIKDLGQLAMPGVPLWIVARALQVWALLFGQISFEVFGRLADSIQDMGTVFEFTVATMTELVGFAPTRRGGSRLTPAGR